MTPEQIREAATMLREPTFMEMGLRVKPGAALKIAEMLEAYADLVAPDGLLADLLEHMDDDCWFDHHGYCQAHGWMETDPECPHARAKRLLGEDSP